MLKGKIKERTFTGELALYGNPFLLSSDFIIKCYLGIVAVGAVVLLLLLLLLMVVVVVVVVVVS